MPNDAPITYHPHPSDSPVRLPPGACDTHCHVFGPTDVFPYAPNAKFRPGDAPKEQLFALHARYGIERCVVVHSSCHGYDNRASADAIAAKPGRYLGIALLPPEASDGQIKELKAQGFRGLRYNYMAHLAGGPPPETLTALAPRLAANDWQLLIHMDPCYLETMSACLAALPIPVVIDHMARIDASLGRDQPAFSALLRLMEHKNIWVKVSGCERASRQDPPYADATPLARELVRTFPDRVLWGTDWPHPNFRAAPPDDGQLVSLLAEIAPTPELMQALLVDNPMKLYQFER